ncbi:MAG TPA: hypothetical protein GXZ74_02425 [Tissierellia bacterium]|nr:hypothetical protein [Tissierellia bacterium]
MIDPKQMLERLGYQLEDVSKELIVYEATKDGRSLYLVDSRYEFDYINEEALIYLLASSRPVLIHVPLRIRYEEYLASFESFRGCPIQFFIQDRDDTEKLAYELLKKRLTLLGFKEE